MRKTKLEGKTCCQGCQYTFAGWVGWEKKFMN